MEGNGHPTLGELIGAEQWAEWQKDGDRVICLQPGPLPRVWSGGVRSPVPEPIWDPDPDTRHPEIRYTQRLHGATVWTERGWWSAEWVPYEEPVSWEMGDACIVRGEPFKPHLRWINHTRPPLPPRS